MEYDVLIIGAGIVGLATALQLLEQKPSLKVLVLEKEPQEAMHQTGNNSGVIHSGIYYKPNSLKAINCIQGYEMMLDFCQKNDVPYELCGKVIVATDKSEIAALEKIYERGEQNGLKNLKYLNESQIREREPHVRGVKGIFVPQTGIVDYRVVAKKYVQLIQEKGGEVRFHEKVKDIKNFRNNSEVITHKRSYLTKLVVNCAGLYSDKMAALNKDNLDYRIIPFRGEYYKLRPEKEYLVKTLIYPVPDPNFPFLGVHFTRMMRGGVEAGPNAVLAFGKESYKKTDFNFKESIEILTWGGFQKVAAKYWKTGMGEMYRSFSKDAFTKALQKLIPVIQKDDLIEGGAGIRAQACDRKGGLIDDFLIVEDQHAIHVGNAPSPAATSSLSIGKTVSKMVLDKL